MFLKYKIIFIMLPLIIFILIILKMRPDIDSRFLYILLLSSFFVILMDFIHKKLDGLKFEVKLRRDKENDQ